MTHTITCLTRRAALIGASAALLASPLVRAQAPAASFPSAPIRLVAPFPAGTGTDLTARAFAKALGDLTGQPVIVDNKAGANGIIAVQTVLNAPADGHTIFLGSNSTLSTNAALLRKLPYDPVRDLTPITVIARAPCVVIVPPKSPYKTLGELLAAARKNPGKLNFGSGSPSYQLYTVWMNDLAGIQGYHVPYKGASDVITAISGGQLDYAVVDFTAALPLIQGGRVRALALADDHRSSALPDLPTSKEAGLPGYLAYNWTAAAVSSKTPAPVVAQIEALFAKAGKSKEVVELFDRIAIKPTLSTGAQMRQFQVEEIARWKRLAESAKLQMD